MFDWKKNNLFTFHSLAFTLAEVLIVLGIIGIVAEMTIPTLVSSTQEKVEVTGIQKFSATLQQAVMMWKASVDCNEDAAACISYQSLADNDTSAFEKTFGQFMKITDKVVGANTVDWLPDDTLNYYGNSVAANYGKVAHSGCSNVVYLLQDGMTLTMDFTPPGFAMYVDVNGKKKPNRIGKDTFPITVGFAGGKDVYYYSYYDASTTHNTMGLCGLVNLCDPNNVNPSVGLGASPTAYTILNGKLPDFKALSQSVAGFKP